MEGNLIEILSRLFSCVSELEKKYNDRKFTLDGHLLGSIGEVVAKEYYGIILLGQSQKVHDGELDGLYVQIKITQRDRIDIAEKPKHLLVLFLDSKEKKFYEVYNGSGDRAWTLIGKRNGNFYSISIRKLNKLNNDSIDADGRIPPINKNNQLPDYSEYISSLKSKKNKV